MYCVQRTSERPFDGALRRIDSKDQGADRCLPRSFLRQSNEPSKCRNHARAQQSHGAPLLCDRSEEHTSELQSLTKLVCRLLLEKKKTPCTKNPPRSIAAL